MASAEKVASEQVSPLDTCDRKKEEVYRNVLDSLIDMACTDGTEAAMLVRYVDDRNSNFILHWPALDSRVAATSLRYWIREYYYHPDFDPETDNNGIHTGDYIVTDSDQVLEIVGIAPEVAVSEEDEAFVPLMLVLDNLPENIHEQGIPMDIDPTAQRDLLCRLSEAVPALPNPAPNDD